MYLKRMRNRLLLGAILLLPAACAVYTPYPLGILGKRQPVLAVQPSAISAPVHALSDITDHPGKPAGPVPLQHALAGISQGVDASVQHWLTGPMRLHTIPLSADGQPQAALAQAKKAGADLLLGIDVSGYGRVKRRWIVLLFGSGVIEGLTQGVVVTNATGNPALGIGVGAEEVLSEGLTWVGGSWLWGKYFAPVTLEGRMWRVRDGRLVWHDVRMADNSDDVWKLVTGKPLPGKKQALANSLEEAEKGLFRDLGRYMHQQILLHRGRGKG